MNTIAPTGVVGLLVHLAPLLLGLGFAVWVAVRAPLDTEDRPFHYVPDDTPVDWNVWERDVWGPRKWEGSE